MLTKYGFVCAKFNGMQFDLNPTLEAMARIGNKEDIIQVFSKLHCITIREFINSNPYQCTYVSEQLKKYSKKVTGPQQLQAAILVLQCCSGKDLSPMIGKLIVKDRVYYQKGFAPVQNIISLAQHMIYHGMIGHTENKITSNRAGTTADFEPERFAELARLKLNMSRDEAWSLTMTEFIVLWNTEFPPTEKQMDESITQDEYDDGIAKLEAIRDKALRKKQ